MAGHKYNGDPDGSLFKNIYNNKYNSTFYFISKGKL
jgi:hypothetical protein